MGYSSRGYKELDITEQLSREGNGTPLQYSCLENPMDRGAWWAPVHGVVKSQTRLSDFTFTFHFHALEKEMATHSSVLAWRIPGTAEPGGLPSMGSHRAGQDWSDLAAAAEPLTHTHTHTHTHTLSLSLSLLYKTKTVKYLVNLKMNWESMKVFPEFKFSYHQSMKSLAENWYYDGKSPITWSGIYKFLPTEKFIWHTNFLQPF